MEAKIQKAVDALSGLVEVNGLPPPEAYAAGREVLAELREVLAPVVDPLVAEQITTQLGGADGNA